jgi:hypothetical protein
MRQRRQGNEIRRDKGSERRPRADEVSFRMLESPSGLRIANFRRAAGWHFRVFRECECASTDGEEQTLFVRRARHCAVPE